MLKVTAGYASFRQAYPAIRCFQRYTAEDRASHRASRRLGPRAKERVGEFFYVHPMIPGRAFATAKAATTAAFNLMVAREKA